MQRASLRACFVTVAQTTLYGMAEACPPGVGVGADADAESMLLRDDAFCPL